MTDVKFSIQVDQHTNDTPKKRIVSVPSMSSIEEMRCPAFENIAEKKSTWSHGHADSKIPHLAFSPIRTPFTDVN